MEKSIFCIRLKQLRKGKGFRQEDMAATIGKSRSLYNQWESGKREPQLKEIKTIAEIFDVSIDWLLGVDKSKEQKNDNT